MNTETVTAVRIYITEGDSQLKSTLKRLRDWEHLRGVTIFRGIAGFGTDGVIHDAGLIDTSLDLPVVIEFFDSPDKVESVLEHLSATIAPGHILTWQAQVNA